MSKEIEITITSAVVVDGKIAAKGAKVTVPVADAKDLIQRGKAELKDGAASQKSELEKLKVDELRAMAEDLAIEGFADMKKADLISAIEAADE